MLTQSEVNKRKDIKKYFERNSLSWPVLLIFIGLPLIFFGIGLILIIIGIVALILGARGYVSDSKIDEWLAQDQKKFDYVARAKIVSRMSDFVRDPVLLIGNTGSTSSLGVTSGEILGDDGLIRSTPQEITVLLCTDEQIGIFQAGLDHTTGNLVNERYLEAFYQDVVSIGVSKSTDTVDTKNALKNARFSNLDAQSVAKGWSSAKIIKNLKKLRERFADDLVGDILQRDLRFTYRIDFSDGQHVAINIRDGRATREANASNDAAAGDGVAQQMANLRAFVRDKKRGLLRAAAIRSGSTEALI